MGTIAPWAFFVFWGGALIQSLLHRNLTLMFNFAFQIYIVHEFFVGNVEMTWKTILAAIFKCWALLVLTCVARGITQFLRERRKEREARGQVRIMNSREANELGYREAKAHPILIFGLYGICATVALTLPIFWYWKIAAFLAMIFIIALVRMSFGVISGRFQLSDN